MVAGGELMVKVALMAVLPVVLTVTVAAPALAIKRAGTKAVRLTSLMLLTASAVEPHLTIEVELKLFPEMVSVKAAPPATAEAGVRPIHVGTAADATDARARATGMTTANRRKKECSFCICPPFGVNCDFTRPGRWKPRAADGAGRLMGQLEGRR